MEEVMCLEGERQYFERCLWFYGESAIIFMYICEERDCYSSLTKITEGGLDNDYIKLSCKIRKQGELCPVFGFFLLWEGGLLLRLCA